MVIGDLFSGIGGFSLAAHWMGWRTAWFSEIDPFASRVLAHHWPDVPNHGDITRIDWTTVEPVDVLTGGFPCQPHSLAGKRAGSNDERDLFDEIIRAARVLRPRYIVLENVPGLFTSDDGRFFGRVLGSVAALGYDAEWRVLSASDVGAPHRRERVWITAYANGEQHESGTSEKRWTSESFLLADAENDGAGRRDQFAEGGEGAGDVADAEVESIGTGLRAHESRRIGRGLSGDSGGAHDVEDTHGGRFGRDDQHRFAEPRDARAPSPRDTRRWWATEPDVGRSLDGFSAWLDEGGTALAHKLYSAYGNATEERPEEIVRAVRDCARQKGDGWETRGSRRVSSSSVLFALVRELEKRSDAWLSSVEGSQAEEGSVRGVRADNQPTGPSRRPGSVKQRSGERADVVQAVSRLLALDAEEAWLEYRRQNASVAFGWEEGVARVATGIPARVDRLRCLGNSIVPQCALEIFRSIDAREGRVAA